MLANESQIVISYLMNGYEGDFVEHEDGRYVEVVNMAGGRYALFDQKRRISGLVNNAEAAYDFLCK